jgi:hypothetical protein
MNMAILTEDMKCLPSTSLEIKPGRLIKLGETLEFSATGPGRLRLCRGLAGDFSELAAVDLLPGEPWQFTPTEPGMYLAEIEMDGQWLRRPLAVVGRGWSVCQITVGAFTAEDFAETIHQAGINADYYVGPQKHDGSTAFSFTDPRWVRYEREFGDAIYPHVMANSLGDLEPGLAYEDANWEAMPIEGIIERLRFLQEWWVSHGYAPLDRIASYTPCNRFIEALQQCGIRILHSVVPEQNWSDGEWSINHWGMPTCPFWIAPDDFRKAGPRTPGGVLAMTMNHYHVLLPHLTMWGDFVLSPSHFTRWIRAADSGEASTRYQEFLRDTLHNWTSLSDDPFFFVAGYEFGRTFGTANMTEYNQHGLEALIDFSRREKLVFATGSDVLAYYDRHQPGHPETAFRQRDYWVGVTVNNKPGQAGDSVVLERRDYKAVIREGELLPFFHYDYRVQWSFATRDMHAPHDFAPEDRQQLCARVNGEMLELEATQPLARAIPLAVWDADIEGSPFEVISLPELEDGRKVVALEIPAGWSGKQSLKLKPVAAPLTRRNDLWKMQTFGQGDARHTYLHLDAPLTRNAMVSVELKKRVRVDSATGSLGEQGPGELHLEFGLLQGWYRFWQCGIEDIVPEEAVEQKLKAQHALLTGEWPLELSRHQAAMDKLVEQRLRPDEKIIHQVYCGAKVPLGTRSRADDFNQVTIPHPTLYAHEKADGVIAFGPGQSFWYHPRHMPFRIDGFPTDPAARRWKILLHTFDPLGLEADYKVSVGAREAGLWKIPTDSYAPGAFFELEVQPGDLNSRGELSIKLLVDQTPLLRWWKDRGAIAALHALWVIEVDETKK